MLKAVKFKKKMNFTTLCSLICCLLFVVLACGFNNNGEIKDFNNFQTRSRRQLSTQQHIFTDVQKQHSQTRQIPQQLLHFQRQESAKVPSAHYDQQKNHFLTNSFQHNQLSGLDQNLIHLRQHQQKNGDLHSQDFTSLKSFSNQQIGPQQSLPQRSVINKPFQSAWIDHSQQQQSSSLPQKISSETSGSIFQINPSAQKTFSTFGQLNQQQLPQQQYTNKQNQQLFQTGTNFGFPLPQVFQNPQPELQAQRLPEKPPTPQQQSFFNPQEQYAYVSTPQPQSADLEYKQKIIQKHEQFVQKQYEKSQNKIRKEHEEFLASQHAIKEQILPEIVRSQQQNIGIKSNSLLGRPVTPVEYQSFASALAKHQQEHPTTSTTTTTTTTERSIDGYKLNKDIFSQVKAESSKYGDKISSNSKGPIKTVGRDELFKQLKAALIETRQSNEGNKKFDEMDLVLPNGQRVTVIQTTDPNLTNGQKTISQDELEALIAQKPTDSGSLFVPNGERAQNSGNKDKTQNAQNFSTAFGTDFANIANEANSVASTAYIQSNSDMPPTLEELQKRGLIPEGYEVEGLSSASNEALQKSVPTTSAKKKATYVYLEEHADGSFKIQGVKANGEKETKQTGEEVESILERIRSGEIKLPPLVRRLKLPNDEEVEILNGNIVKTTKLSGRHTSTPTPNLTATTSGSLSSAHRHHSPAQTTKKPLSPDQKRTEPDNITISPNYTNIPVLSTITKSLSLMQTTESSVSASQQIHSDAIAEETSDRKEENSKKNVEGYTEDLTQILKENGLFGMAKFLKQSGLDNVLSETGPYTVFVPTDKAFKNLLVQLGGPERAEEKFKANPRLLSGLLLHHVIPGAFEIATLQDEMTGVSLAGTQLRVNQYAMHDQEWNDVTLTTINGAMIVPNKKDIKIPQGVAHAVDRVMFPLPIGDLLQTLQSDREKRFTIFLKVLFTSGLSEKLQSKGIKTYTVFAPVDKSFAEIESDMLEKLYNNKEIAEEFAMKHIVPGTLFSAGMRFYQVKDSLLTGKTVILQKTSAGKIKVNDAQMVMSNIPATNGVIHAIDGVLA